MKCFFTVEYWKDDNWFIRKLIEIGGVFSQCKTLKEPQKNMTDAHPMMLETATTPTPRELGALVTQSR